MLGIHIYHSNPTSVWLQSLWRNWPRRYRIRWYKAKITVITPFRVIQVIIWYQWKARVWRLNCNCNCNVHWCSFCVSVLSACIVIVCFAFDKVLLKNYTTTTTTTTTCTRSTPTRRLKAHHRVNPYLGARRQNETKMFSGHDETSPSIAVVSAPSVACSMLAVQQQKRLCHQFIDMSAIRRGCHTTKPAVYRSTRNIGNRCQKVWDIFRHVSQKRLVNQQAQVRLASRKIFKPSRKS